MKYIRWFDQITIKDIPHVGGKNASLGQMIQGLKNKGIKIPNGFAITSEAYWYYLKFNGFEQKIKQLLRQIKSNNVTSLQKNGKAIRLLLASGTIPDDLAHEITQSYDKLSKQYHQKECDVAVRSSATAEDLPTASFAGQQETFLNIKGHKELLLACKKSIASLFTDRAIIYRIDKGFDHFDVALSIGVQKMIRSDKACSGVAFSLDTQTGFKDVVTIDASYGLGEAIVKGLVTPDEYYVFKTTLEQGYKPIIKKKLGEKEIQYIYTASSKKPIKKVAVSKSKQEKFCLTDDEIIELAQMVVTIDHYYSAIHKKWTPMDVEWAKDGNDGTLYIVQARPETVHSQEDQHYVIEKYRLLKKAPQPLVSGVSIGEQIVSGVARVITSLHELARIKPGEILVTKMTDPDWVPVMKKVAGIVTDLGGRTCHAAIVSRELKTAALVGTETATKKIKTGDLITLDCSSGAVGYVYKGKVAFEKEKINVRDLPKPPVELLVNSADPDRAFIVSTLPVSGVGLARIEFIISSMIQIHPMALLHPNKVKDKAIQKKIEKITSAYPNKKQFFIDTLAHGIGMIAAAFYPRSVIVRFSDFKSNEYSDLLGGSYFEHKEENPMLGFRGASRYTNTLYQEAFELECAALRKVREQMGLQNVRLMIPFVRTINEAHNVIKELKRYGLQQGKNKLELVMMCEIPANVLLMNEFSALFDGFSIGSNDLTQLTLGVDRDSAILAGLFDERNEAVKKMFVMAIDGAHRNKRFIGICGEAPSDYPELADFLIKHGIDSISLNADSVVPFLMRLKKKR